MSLFFADVDNITFGVQGSNVKEVAQFSSTLDDVFMRFFTNNGSATENYTTGTVIGSSNYDKSGTQANDLYFGHLTEGSNIQRIMTIKDERVGINTSSPTATLHVIGSNIPYSNILQVEAINSPAYPALVIDKYGYVGIGTTPVSGQELTVKGTLVVDQIKIGAGESGPNSNLISAYGMAPPLDTDHLTFANTTFCNVQEIVTQQVTATNLLQLFKNIADRTFMDNATVSIGAIAPNGNVPFTTTFNGNSPTYYYRLNVTSNNFTYTTSTITVSGTSQDLHTHQFGSGTYDVNLFAYTSGIGAGNGYTKSNITTFTVPLTDSIGTPTVTNVGTPTFSSVLTYVSGIPYYTAGVTMTIPTNSLYFTNIYNTIDPRTILTNALTLKDSTNNTNVTNYTYANVFTNVLEASSSNTVALTLTLSSTATASDMLVNVGRTVYNVNNQSGVAGTLLSGIFYCGSSISEGSINVATFTNMPITTARRMSISAASGSPLTPSLVDVSGYSGTPSTHDAWYAADGKFYSSAT
jgi:hypothetical protein